MGVPQFNRWLIERYPSIIEKLKDFQIPEFDNLFLDMNSIIHKHSNIPNSLDDIFEILEETMFKDIFCYLDVIFQLIKPQKLLVLSIDGDAPNAKRNQKRKNRRSQSENDNKDEPNCIKPGTEFMVMFQKQLEYFVSMKVSTDPLWLKVQVILSGHQVPGEGEHKIMEIIRHQKSHPDYNVDTRHCLYGLDADLTMLGLCSHEPYFSLLREDVEFGEKNRKETTFHLLHLSLLREYLDLEFTPLKKSLPFHYDLERVIDDWVFLGFHVGNDFIPNLPHFKVDTGALSILYDVYIAVLPTLGGYLSDKGALILERYQKLIESLLDAMISRPSVNHKVQAEDFEEGEILDESVDYGYEEDSDEVRKQVHSYVKTMQWLLKLYLLGHYSWSWRYKYRDAPSLKDIRQFISTDLNLDFKHDQPPVPRRSLIGNHFGSILEFHYVQQDLGPMQGPDYLSSLSSNHCQRTEIEWNYFALPASESTKALDLCITPVHRKPGFPSFRHLPIEGTIRESGGVYNITSHNDSMIVSILQDSTHELDVEEIARVLCGRTVYINWPYPTEALVIAVANLKVKCGYQVESHLEGGGAIYQLEEPLVSTVQIEEDAEEWHQTEDNIRTHYAKTLGIEIGPTQVFVYTSEIVGAKKMYAKSGSVDIIKQWSPFSTPVPLQIVSGDKYFYATLADDLPSDTNCFIVAKLQPYYAQSAEIISSAAALKGKVQIKIQIVEDKIDEKLKEFVLNSAKSRYMSANEATKKLLNEFGRSIKTQVFARITGTLLMSITPSTSNQLEELNNSNEDRRRSSLGSKLINIGLRLKFSMKKEEVIGFTKKIDDTWMYSIKTIIVIDYYMSQFPEVFEYLDTHTDPANTIPDLQVFGQDFIRRSKELKEFMARLTTTGAQRQPCLSIDDDYLYLIAKYYSTRSSSSSPESILMDVWPNYLFKPDGTTGRACPDPLAVFKVWDRVVNVTYAFSDPLCLRGTIIGTKHSDRPMHILYEVLFDEQFAGALPIRGDWTRETITVDPRVYLLPAWAMMNITHGLREASKAQLATQSFQSPTGHVDKRRQSASPRFSSPVYNKKAQKFRPTS